MRTKILSLIMTALMLLAIPVFAADIEIQPTMLSKSNSQDRVWVGTFQIVWNEFMDKYVRSTVRFREGTPVLVQDLNKRTFSAASLSNKCYYKYSGNITPNTAKNIKKAIAKKFNETSDILDKLDLRPGPDRYLIYTMLKKDFEFTNEFDKLGKSAFGKDKVAEYFGIAPKTDAKVKRTVTVLYYNNPDDFAVKLSTTGEDEVFIYKNGANKEFKQLYRDMTYKASKFKGETVLGEEDELKVPNIKFDALKSFDDLCNKRVMGTNITITQALESVKFNMDNKGAQLKSEAAMTFVKSAMMPVEEVEKPKPRYFYCDNTFVIFLKEKEQDRPYFALRVNDISKFQ